MNFEFTAPNRIIFGNGALSKVRDIAGELGLKTLVVCGGGSVPTDELLRYLNEAGTTIEIFRVEHEPDVPTIEAGLAKARATKSDFVVGYGGGSVLDTGKAIAAMLTNPGDLQDYLEVIGGGQKIPEQPAPMIAIPTTAGTGTEVTRNAVVASPEHKVKVSMRSPMMIPPVAIIDPELTYTLPPSVTASTGMDALTQVVEAYVSIKSNPMTDAVAKEGIKRGAHSLLRAYRNGGDMDAREDMALTSLFGGLALANAGLGAVHGFAGPIGGMFDAPHGVICASLLPYVMKYNVRTITDMDGYADYCRRYEQIAQWVTSNEKATIQDGVAWFKDLAEALDIPRLRDIGIGKDDFDRIIEKARVSSSMQKNPVRLDDATLKMILTEAY